MSNDASLKRISVKHKCTQYAIYIIVMVWGGGNGGRGVRFAASRCSPPPPPLHTHRHRQTERQTDTHARTHARTHAHTHETETKCFASLEILVSTQWYVSVQPAARARALTLLSLIHI